MPTSDLGKNAVDVNSSFQKNKSLHHAPRSANGQPEADIWNEKVFKKKPQFFSSTSGRMATEQDGSFAY